MTEMGAGMWEIKAGLLSCITGRSCACALQILNIVSGLCSGPHMASTDPDVIFAKVRPTGDVGNS
jgi:hypothetical protein